MLNAEEKALKEKYIEMVVHEEWSDRAEEWTKYFNKDIDRVVKFESGRMISISKPSIKTHFCFGYSDSGYDLESASGMANHAKTHEDYFIEENLKEIEQWIKAISDNENHLYSTKRYDGAPENSMIAALQIVNDWEHPMFSDGFYKEKYKDFQELTENDRTVLIDAYKRTKADFEKRLHTYLKRYGLSKIESWTYWQDE